MNSTCQASLNMHHQVGELSLMSPLPPGWVFEETAVEQRNSVTLGDLSRAMKRHRLWKDKSNGAIRDSSPMDPYFIELRNRRRWALAR